MVILTRHEIVSMEALYKHSWHVLEYCAWQLNVSME